MNRPAKRETVGLYDWSRAPTSRIGSRRGCGPLFADFVQCGEFRRVQFRHWPGVRSPSEIGPTDIRTNRKVG